MKKKVTLSREQLVTAIIKAQISWGYLEGTDIKKVEQEQKNLEKLPLAVLAERFLSLDCDIMCYGAGSDWDLSGINETATFEEA